ncbi:DNA double-strand break repair nuclease NurA [Sulfuracidifex tepidarius]|uniref:DNA double-strand break repair nuclease NurA n=1 Tax=Sulfuracidifex tepidarius TaxID=1294262 RepID=A0A510DYP5_9CREN|nr:DNA double-strand break repair nuclease NurA [Sulfuracidifex tepidarius]BBG25345.1 DNA double-strand break repair nuclease NurA [Sulfuracidifex tepidarius]BBG28139.1 DNA double-strand break repair nuclease NurA [Sulfuracidifex tepidarius]
MIKEVYNNLVDNYLKIKKDLFAFSQEISKETQDKVNDIWVPYVPKPEDPKGVLAIDGGMFSKEVRTGVVFVVNAEAVYHDGEKTEPKDKMARVGVFKPGNDARDMTGYAMELMELKLALHNPSPLILMDGSIKKKIGKKIDERYLYLLDQLKETDKSREILSLEMKTETEIKNSLILENKLLISAIKERGRTVWISKKSRSTDVFNSFYSDMTLLELFTRGTGYTKPKIHFIDVGSIEEVPELKKLGGEYSTFYVRLSNGSMILRVDVFGRITCDEIEHIMNKLHSDSIKGYPYPLIKAHSDVKVSKDDRARILSMIGRYNNLGVSWWPSQFR